MTQNTILPNMTPNSNTNPFNWRPIIPLLFDDNSPLCQVLNWGPPAFISGFPDPLNNFLFPNPHFSSPSTCPWIFRFETKIFSGYLPGEGDTPTSLAALSISSRSFKSFPAWRTAQWQDGSGFFGVWGSENVLKCVEMDRKRNCPAQTLGQKLDFLSCLLVPVFFFADFFF